ncbi:ATP-dependent helicase HrpB [Brevibacterium senegalense]|uniref:ATP-dependent helicase HrpB n=1 Tax=Brevibacterium senegalense TaxID=1033736 RepID=UPI0003124D6B|nr:ATP-dependent helicase HrpB [Brevibacterium senegalense]
MPQATPFDPDRIGAGLPAAALIGDIRRLAAAGPGLRAVVEAPPGTGKTTVIPPALQQALTSAAGSLPAAEAATRPARVLVSQPRRVAARAAAARLASLSGHQVGEEVGHTVRGDRLVSARTVVEFATTGVVLRRLLADPELTGIDAVILDEVHERSLESDLAFAMLRELLDLRDDLALIVMSATLDAGDWAQLLGTRENPAPILRVDAATHPLTVHWAPPAQRGLDARGVRPDFLTHIAATVDRALDEDDGDVLVFAPGHREVDRVAAQVRDRRADVEVLTLTGSTPRAQQDAVLRGGERTGGASSGAGAASARRRVVVATSVAESALTVPGVRIVVDSCLSRVPHFDSGRGAGGLTTVRESKAAGDQRAGRAAREAPGTVWRCCAEADWAAFPAHTPPEVLTADLTGAALDLAVWGSPGGAGLPLPTPLPALPLVAATRILHGLGALESPVPEARATQLGRSLAAVPADPRTARGLLLAASAIGARAAAECAALLTLDVRASDGDLAQALRAARSGGERAPHGWRTEVRRLERLASSEHDTGVASHGPRSATPPAGSARPDAARELGIVLALSRPDMIARLREGSADEYLLASGTGGQLPRGSALAGSPWIAVGDLSVVGERTLIRAAVAIDEDIALWAGSALRTQREDTDWIDGRIRARRVEALGAITLTSTPVGVSEDGAREALRAAVGRALTALAQGDAPEAAFAGLATAGEAQSFSDLRDRLGLLHAVIGVPWPDVRAAHLAETAEEWLGLELDRTARALAAGSGRSAGLRLHEALQGLLPWPEAADLDRLAPTRVDVPSGSSVRLAYPLVEHHGAGATGAGSAPPDGTVHDAPEAAHPDPVAAPVLPVKLQEMFGADTGPAVVDGRVPVLLHLLSPARRPLAVTADLASFWAGAYAHVRAENRGRYPKHPWPEDPTTAQPTKFTTKRAARG